MTKLRFDEWHTISWGAALKRIDRLGGLGAFKSVLFKQAFKQSHYACEFMILSLKERLCPPKVLLADKNDQNWLKTTTEESI